MRIATKRVGALLLPLACCVTSCTSSPLTLSVVGSTVQVLSHGLPFATVEAGAEPRPYVWPLYGPGQVAMTRNHPMAKRDGEEPDHPHHQSLWLAHGSVNGFDFWHGKQHRERQVLQRLNATLVQAPDVLVQCDYRWLADDDTEVLQESRQLRFSEVGDARYIDVTSELRALHGDVRFGDTKEGTFAVRVHPALRAEGKVATGVLSNSEGHVGNAAWGKQARWLDDSGVVDGKEVGIAMFDHPSNLRHATWWHARSYGLLAANPFGAHDFAKQPVGAGDYVLKQGETLTLRYRVVLHGADWGPLRIQAAYDEWANS